MFWSKKEALPPPGDYYTGEGPLRRLGSSGKYGCSLVAMPGWGKNALSDAMLMDAVRNGKRVVANDYSGDLDHRLRSVAPPGYEVYRIDPAVVGGDAVDVTKTWVSETYRSNFAEAWSPSREGDPNDFFPSFVQLVIISVTGYSTRCSPDWVLADLPRVAADPELVDALGDHFPEWPSPFRLTGVFSRSGRDVRATLAVKMQPLRIYSSLCLRAKRLLNPMDFVHGKPCAAVFVVRDKYKAAMSKVYPYVFDVINEEKLSTVGGDMLVEHIDEVGNFKVRTLPDLARRARKSNLIYSWAAQSREQVLKQFGREDGSDVLNLTGLKILGRQGGKDSALWASESALGVKEVIEDIEPRAYMDFMPREGAEYKRTVRDRPNVHWSELCRCPLASWDQDKIVGWVAGPGVGGDEDWARFEVKFRHLVGTRTAPPALEPVPPEWEILPPLTPLELKDRLRIPGEVLEKAAEARDRNRKRQEGAGRKKKRKEKKP